jgi:hypothetical protein
MARDYKALFAICKQYGLNYKDKVLEFTNGRTDSLSSLTDSECEVMVDRLKKLNKIKVNRGGKKFEVKPGDPQRKKMIRLALTMHWGNGDMAEALKELDEWCFKQKFKKGFMGHTLSEYDLLVSIFETKVYKDYLRDLNK